MGTLLLLNDGILMALDNATCCGNWPIIAFDDVAVVVVVGGTAMRMPFASNICLLAAALPTISPLLAIKVNVVAAPLLLVVAAAVLVSIGTICDWVLPTILTAGTTCSSSVTIGMGGDIAGAGLGDEQVVADLPSNMNEVFRPELLPTLFLSLLLLLLLLSLASS